MRNACSQRHDGQARPVTIVCGTGFEKVDGRLVRVEYYHGVSEQVDMDDLPCDSPVRYAVWHQLKAALTILTRPLATFVPGVLVSEVDDAANERKTIWTRREGKMAAVFGCDSPAQEDQYP